MKVCIAEKPSVAKEIAYIIGAKSRKDGYFEGNGYQVTWTFGHLCTLKLPDDYKPEWKRWDLYALPMMPEKFETKLITNKGVKKQFGVIKSLFKKASVVINCGDAGQEGELIQRWVMNQANYKGKVQRLWISSLTPEAIRDGFKQLKDAKLYDNLYYAGISRAIGDWLLGMNATRLFTIKYGAPKQVLSIGRVQTPTLSMLVNRHIEIETFVPEPYWELHTVYRETTFAYEKGRFKKKEDGQELLERVTGKPFTILSSTRKEGKEYPPRLFDLTSLQVHCNKRFGYSADQTLKLVQKLYEQKVVTYPRVDTTYLPNDVYPKVAGILGKMKQYSQFTQPLLGKKIRKSTKVFNDAKVTDHHAIIPTGSERGLNAMEQNVYDAIARRFIAAFYPDCLVAKTTVIGEVDEIKFKATGKEILKPGWRVLYPKPKKKIAAKDEAKKKEEEVILPEFKKGETGPHEPILAEKMTQPPKNYTEATLLRAMETAGKTVDDDELRDLMKANGIGRPSTRANIIETLFKRRYAQRKRKQIVPTEIGVQLITTIENELLKSAELTGQWEKQLGDIAKGEHTPQQFVHDMKVMLVKLVNEVRNATVRTRIGSANSSAKTPPKRTPNKSKQVKKSSLATAVCPKCEQGKLLKGKSAYGCSRYQEGCNFLLPFSFKEKKISEKQLLRLLQYGSTIQLKGFKENGKKVNGNLKFDDNFQLFLKTKATNSMAEKVANKKVFKVKVSDTKVSDISTTNNTSTNTKPVPCPQCAQGQVLRGKTAYGCSRWKEGCDFKYLFSDIRVKAGDKKLTRELVMAIINEG